jgi:dTMP kinase
MQKLNYNYLENFFTFEGGEGSGKTTQAKLLYQAFLDSGIEAIFTREPGGTENAEHIRNLLLHGNSNFHPITQLLLHNASRYEHIKDKIIPNLRENKIVICDRYVDSTMAYQGYGHKLGKKYPALLHNMFMENIVPKFTFILDIDPEAGLKRAKSRAEFDNYEKLDLSFHQRVRGGFLDIAKNAPNRCIIISADDTLENIHQNIIDLVNNLTTFSLKPTKL